MGIRVVNRTAEQVQQKVKEGWSFTCANCDHFWAGMEINSPVCTAAKEGKMCAGPLANMAFPEYQGPLTGSRAQICYACGKNADFILQFRKENGGINIGVCKEHKKMLDNDHEYRIGKP